MIRRILRFILLSSMFITLTSSLGAATHRAVMPPGPGDPQADALGIGLMSGAAVTGTVASVQGTTITLNSGAAPAIRIDASVAKFLAAKGTATISDVKPGARLTAFIDGTAAIAPGAPLHAQLITIESLPDLTVTGTVQAIDIAGSKLTVLGISIVVDANTAFSSAFPTFVAIKGLGDLAAGQVVNVTASFSGANILAKQVQVLAFFPPTAAILSGTVKSISSTAWVITGRDGKDVTVVVDAQTKIVGEPKVGDTVQVMATVDASHNYVAIVILKIDLKLPAPEIVEIHGFVKAITLTQWTIGGPPGSLAPDYLVKITSTTVIAPNIAVGDRVVVTGTRDSTGAIVALKIVKEM